MQKLAKTTPTPAHSITRTDTNKYKYDRTFILAELRDMTAQLLENESWSSKAQLFKNRPYSYSKFNEWKLKNSTNRNIQEAIKKIEEILEARLVERGLNGKAIPMTIFLLKNYYNYQDKREIEQETTHVFKVSRGAPMPTITEVTTPLTIPSTQTNKDKD